MVSTGAGLSLLPWQPLLSPPQRPNLAFFILFGIWRWWRESDRSIEQKDILHYRFSQINTVHKVISCDVCPHGAGGLSGSETDQRSTMRQWLHSTCISSLKWFRKNLGALDAARNKSTTLSITVSMLLNTRWCLWLSRVRICTSTCIANYEIASWWDFK